MSEGKNSKQKSIPVEVQTKQGLVLCEVMLSDYNSVLTISGTAESKINAWSYFKLYHTPKSSFQLGTGIAVQGDEFKFTSAIDAGTTYNNAFILTY